jgi:hypothetical protein
MYSFFMSQLNASVTDCNVWRQAKRPTANSSDVKLTKTLCVRTQLVAQRPLYTAKCQLLHDNGRVTNRARQ